MAQPPRCASAPAGPRVPRANALRRRAAATVVRARPCTGGQGKCCRASGSAAPSRGAGAGHTLSLHQRCDSVASPREPTVERSGAPSNPPRAASRRRGEGAGVARRRCARGRASFDSFQARSQLALGWRVGNGPNIPDGWSDLPAVEQLRTVAEVRCMQLNKTRAHITAQVPPGNARAPGPLVSPVSPGSARSRRSAVWRDLRGARRIAARDYARRRQLLGAQPHRPRPRSSHSASDGQSPPTSACCVRPSPHHGHTLQRVKQGPQHRDGTSKVLRERATASALEPPANDLAQFWHEVRLPDQGILNSTCKAVLGELRVPVQ